MKCPNASSHALKAGKPRKGSIIVDSDHATYVYGVEVTCEAKDELNKQSLPEQNVMTLEGIRALAR